MTKAENYSDITPDMIRDWKAKYGEDVISEISVPITAEKTARFVARMPDRTVMDAVGQHGVNKNVAGSNKTLLSNCILGGDMDYLERHGDVYTSVLRAVNGLLTQKEAEVKKL